MPRFSPALTAQQGCLTMWTAALTCSQSLLRVLIPFGEESPRAVSAVWRAAVRSAAEHLVRDCRTAPARLAIDACNRPFSFQVSQVLKTVICRDFFFFFSFYASASDCPSRPTSPRKWPCLIPYRLYLFRWKIMICGALVMVAFTTASCFFPHEEQWIWLVEVRVSCWKKHLRQSCQREKKKNHLIKQFRTPEDPPEQGKWRSALLWNSS